MARRTVSSSRWSFVFAVGCALGGLACGASGEIAPDPISPQAGGRGPGGGLPKLLAPKPKVTRLARTGVRDTVRGGIGRFLQDVTVDDTPAFRNGKFIGFRVVELRGELDACDLRPGDVVTRVNGQSVEHPEDALVVFQSLANASELVVDYERDGSPQKMRLPISDDGQK